MIKKRQEEVISGPQAKKNVYLLGSSSMFNDIGSEIVTPILPFYISSLGGNGFSIGMLSGLREGLASLLKLFGGWFSDKLGKRMPFVFFGYFFSIISRFLTAFSVSWQAIIGFVSLERIGKIRDAPRDAVIAQTSLKKGESFGIHQMFDSFGGVLGTIIVIFLFWKLEFSFKHIVLVAAFFSLFSLLPLLFVKEPKFKKSHTSIFSEVHHLNSKLKYFLFVAAIFALANFGLSMFILLRIKELKGAVISLVLFACFNLVYSLASPYFGRKSDSIGRKKILVLGYSLFVLISVGLAFFSSLGLLALLFLAYGIVYAITEPVQKAFVADYSGEHKGTAMGFYYFIRGLVIIFAGMIAGVIWDINPVLMFYYLAFMGFLALIFLSRIKEPVNTN